MSDWLVSEVGLVDLGATETAVLTGKTTARDVAGRDVTGRGATAGVEVERGATEGTSAEGRTLDSSSSPSTSWRESVSSECDELRRGMTMQWLLSSVLE